MVDRTLKSNYYYYSLFQCLWVVFFFFFPPLRRFTGNVVRAQTISVNERGIGQEWREKGRLGEKGK